MTYISYHKPPDISISFHGKDILRLKLSIKFDKNMDIAGGKKYLKQHLRYDILDIEKATAHKVVSLVSKL